jgi:hypothetical protein
MVKKYRRSTILFALVMLVFGVVLLLERAIPADAIEAKTLVLTDERGRERILLGTLTGDGAPYMFFLDKSGRGRVAIVLNGNGVPQVELYGEQREPTGIFALTDSGRPFLDLRVPGGNSAGIGVTNSDAPYVNLYQREPGYSIGLDIPAHGLPSITLGHSTIKEPKRTPLTMSLTDGVNPRIEFKDASGRGRLVMGLEADGKASISVMDEHGQKESLDVE